MADINQFTSWQDISQPVRELILNFSRKQNHTGLIQFYMAIRDLDFTFQEQLYIINYLSENNFYFQEMSFREYLYPETRPDSPGWVWMEKVFLVMDTWQEAWMTAIHCQVTYRGFNSELQSLYGIVRN